MKNRENGKGNVGVEENLLQNLSMCDKINISVYERNKNNERFGIGKCDKE